MAWSWMENIIRLDFWHGLAREMDSGVFVGSATQHILICYFRSSFFDSRWLGLSWTCTALDRIRSCHFLDSMSISSYILRVQNSVELRFIYSYYVPVSSSFILALSLSEFRTVVGRPYNVSAFLYPPFSFPGSLSPGSNDFRRNDSPTRASSTSQGDLENHGLHSLVIPMAIGGNILNLPMAHDIN